MNHLDACPDCCTNTELPHTIYTIGAETTAAYKCSSCGHVWTTSWRDG